MLDGIFKSSCGGQDVGWWKERGGENGEGKSSLEKPGRGVTDLALQRPWLEGSSDPGFSAPVAHWNHLGGVCSYRGSDVQV